MFRHVVFLSYGRWDDVNSEVIGVKSLTRGHFNPRNHPVQNDLLIVKSLGCVDLFHAFRMIPMDGWGVLATVGR